MADDEFEAKETKLKPIFMPEHEKLLNPFEDAEEYFTYWLHKMRDTPKRPKRTWEYSLQLPDGSGYRHGRDSGDSYSLEREKRANPEWWESLMSLRNTASFISEYIYNSRLMDKLKKIPDAVPIMHECCKYFMEHDSRTGLPGVCYIIGEPVPGSPFQEYGYNQPHIEKKIPILPGCDGPFAWDRPPTPPENERMPLFPKRKKIIWENYKDEVLARRLYKVQGAHETSN
jgi:hypothetical protein